jgi:hypothetical protein
VELQPGGRQVRNILLIAIAVPLFVHDVELAAHGVMVDPAVLVADDRVGAGPGRRDRQQVVIAMHHGHLLKFEGKSWRLEEAAARIAQRGSSH